MKNLAANQFKTHIYKQVASRRPTTYFDFVTKPQSEPALVTTGWALCNRARLFGQRG